MTERRSPKKNRTHCYVCGTELNAETKKKAAPVGKCDKCILQYAKDYRARYYAKHKDEILAKDKQKRQTKMMETQALLHEIVKKEE